MKSDLFAPVSKELQIVEKSLEESIDSKLATLNSASLHLLDAGGKRLRPAFALLSARLFRDDLTEIIPMATALELIHMATLVHDDVIDNSITRRGSATVKSAWGNRISIYAGNYVFARALAIVAGYERSDIVDVLADASMRICEGEIEQMMSCFNVNIGLKNYLRRIERKTALLIEISCQLGAMLCNASDKHVIALKRYGYYLGMAFQITDDILDFVADEEILGKPTGSDIKQGIITLPAIYALQYSPQKQELAALLSSHEACQHQSNRIIEIILDSEGINYAYYVCQHFAMKARRQLAQLPDKTARQTFYMLADYIQERDF